MCFNAKKSAQLQIIFIVKTKQQKVDTKYDYSIWNSNSWRINGRVKSVR